MKSYLEFCHTAVSLGPSIAKAKRLFPFHLPIWMWKVFFPFSFAHEMKRVLAEKWKQFWNTCHEELRMRNQKMKWRTVSFLLLQEIHLCIMKFRYCLIHVETWLFSVLHTRIHERHREWTKRNVRIFARAKKRAPPHTELTNMRGGMGSTYILSSLRLVLVQCVK